mmetsp:Transcript_28485/g.43528  ORF Transcript_28485/g.43528 Transcript_28485/m.43528 type:complete len:404 (-) Transcript_28485:33-1244(-)
MQFSMLLIVLAAFFTFSNGFITTRLSVPLRPVTLQPRRISPSSTKLKAISQKRISSYATKIFPPIPERIIEDNNTNAISNATEWNNVAALKKCITNQFHPGFIRSEFLIGFRYMLHCFKWLFGAAIICHGIRLSYLLSITELPPDIMIKDVCTPFHAIDSFLKQTVFGNLNPQGSGFLFNTLVAPIVEEITYRGIVHTVWQASLQLFLLLNAWLASINIGLVYMYFAAVAYTEVLSMGWEVIRRKKPYMLILFAFPTWELIKIKKAEGIHKEEKDTIITQNTSQRKTLADKVVSISLRDPKAAASPEFETKVQQSMNLVARVGGALEFGYSHIQSGMLALPAATAGIQKGVGTCMSSLLVESRLAILRKNLWAPIGAHIAFNLLAQIPLVVILLYARTFGAPS